ncbi:MAG: hypothetical protein M9904_02425 [Chitinophagaceae bacterium]|nr:hypothetical protein [Chitinophagaceae bacterium]
MMTTDQIQEIKEYYSNKTLPEIITLPGLTIHCKGFVATQLHRLENAVPLLQLISYNHLIQLKNELEK